MADREILPDSVKPTHYNVSLRDLDFKNWTYQGTVTYVVSHERSPKKKKKQTLF